MVTLHSGERLDYLLNQCLQIIQSREVFSFSIDAVLLAKFTYVPIQRGKLMDLCSGNGVIPLLLSQRSKAEVTGVEIQERLFDMAQRNVDINGLHKQVKMIHADIKEIPAQLGYNQFDVVTCNPPYFETESDKEINENIHLAIARHEIYCTLEDVIRVSSQLVRQKGKVAMVHRPERLTEILMLMKQYRIEPKRIQFVHPKVDKEANIVLVEGIKDGKPNLKILPAITVYTNGNDYTEEFKKIYYGES